MPTLLIADDEGCILGFCKEAAEMIGYNVITASNGQNAIPQLDQADVYLLDINMPGISGLEILAKIRSNGGVSKKVIMMTGKTTQEQEEQIQMDIFLNHLV